MTSIRDTYKYWIKVGNLKVKYGITDNLSKREREHQNSCRYTIYNGQQYFWKDGHIVQEGNITTREAALEWERVNRCNEY